MQSCKYNPIIRITPKPDPVLAPYPLSPLRKITDSLLNRLEENEIKTIVTQSIKHTGQNSVVNLKERNDCQRRESVKSSGRLPQEDVNKLVAENSIRFEDAYDDSAMVEACAKTAPPESRKGKQEDNKSNADLSHKMSNNQTRHLSNNNVDHLNPSIEQPSSQPRIQNADASTNTIIFSSDIDMLQEKAESLERPPIQRRTVATSTLQNMSPNKSKEILIEDPVASIVGELEKDTKFVHDLSTLIGEKFVEVSNEI
jgi:hypothetical protein